MRGVAVAAAGSPLACRERQPHDEDDMRLPTGAGAARAPATFWLAAAAAAAAALAALAVRAKTRAVEAEHAPMGQFIEVDGVRLHYVVRGEGEPLLLLHGNGSSVLDLECSGLLDRAAERYQVIAFDRPGFGYSSRPRTTVWTPQAQARLIHKALQRLGVRQPIVAGHSLGTQVALALALQFPEDVRSLALMSGYYYPSLRLDAVLGALPAVPVLGDVWRWTVAPWIGRLLWRPMAEVLFAPARVTESFRAYPAWMSLRPLTLRAQAAEMALGVLAAARLRAEYGELRVPVVIMAGTDDRYVDSGWNSVRLHRELDGSELTLAPGAGHMVHHIVPEEVMAAIDAAAAAPGGLHESTPVRAMAARVTLADAPGR
jgi:pimeloyl-ACP methyl ester carboxylesterase